MKKCFYAVLMLLGNWSFAQYMIVGKDSISLESFKQDNLYSLENLGIEQTLKNAQDYLLLQQLAKEKRVDTLDYFKQRILAKRQQMQEAHFFPPKVITPLISEYVNANKTERKVLVFSADKTGGNTTDYAKIYADVLAGKITMEDAIKNHTKRDAEPIYLKAGVVPYTLEQEIAKLPNGAYTTLENNSQSVTFVKVLDTRPSLGYLIFGTLAIANDADFESKKFQIITALQEGKAFSEVTAQFGSTENEKKNGGLVLGSPTLPDEIYNTLKGLKKGGYTTQPILFDNAYYFFYLYDVIPYQLSDDHLPFFKQDMLQSSYRQRVEELLVAHLKESKAYQSAKAYETIKTSYSSLMNFKDPKALLYQFNNHKMTVADLKKELNEKFKDLDKISSKEWKELMEALHNQFVLQAYSADFEFQPEIKKELDAQRRMIFSEYIYSEYIKKEVADNPQWLTEYYNKNKSQYIWEESAKARIAILSDERLLSDIQKQMKDAKKWEALKKKYDGQLNANNHILVYFEEGEMSKDADVFTQYKMPFKKGVHTVKMGDRLLVVAIEELLPKRQMTEAEAHQLLTDAVTEQALITILEKQRAKTIITVEPAFIKDLEKNFKK